MSETREPWMRIQDAAEKAQLAFWAVVADEFPEIKTGDFPPDATARFNEACELSVRTWYEGNLPDPLGDEARLRVRDALRVCGWRVEHDYPGMLSISAGAFMFTTGIHAWDYGSPQVVFPAAKGVLTVEPFENAPTDLIVGCDPEERDPGVIAEAWDFMLRSWLHEQHAKGTPDPATNREETTTCR